MVRDPGPGDQVVASRTQIVERGNFDIVVLVEGAIRDEQVALVHLLGQNGASELVPWVTDQKVAGHAHG